MSEKQTIDEYAAQMGVFIKNRHEFPLDELSKYAGKCVAWSPDGTAIVVSADDFETLERLVDDSGHDPSRCVFSYIDDQAMIGWNGG